MLDIIYSLQLITEYLKNIMFFCLNIIPVEINLIEKYENTPITSV